MHILDKIVAHKKKEVAKNKEAVSIQTLEASPFFQRACYPFDKNVREKTGIISEFKRRSPSKPTINQSADVSHIPQQYYEAGVSAISILTDEHFFGGNAYHIGIAREEVKCPILRKDFIIDEYQIIEAKSIGADVILLITEILTKEEVASFSKLAKELGLQTLLEIHTEAQIDKYTTDINAIGVNNRDLTQFTVDPNHSIRLYPKLPPEACKISESGIHDIDTILKLKDAGFDGFLIGERFMKTEDPGMACKTFIDHLNEKAGAV